MLQQPWTWLLYVSSRVLHVLTYANNPDLEQALSIRQAVYNMLKHDWTILLFYQSCSSIMLNSVVNMVVEQNNLAVKADFHSAFFVARARFFFCLLSFHVEWSGKLFNLNNRKVWKV